MRRRPPLVLGQLPDETVECDAGINATVNLVRNPLWIQLISALHLLHGETSQKAEFPQCYFHVPLR